MAQKLLKTKKAKITPKKDAVKETSIVLVGTYKEKQLAWIKKNGVYNYPVKDGDELTDEACGKVKELWLYADVKSTRHAFAAEFVEKMSREEFVAAYPTYAKLDMRAARSNGRAVAPRPPHKAYYVFKTTPLDYGPASDGSIVIARTSDFGGRSAKVKKAIEQFKADGEFAPLAAYLPSDLAKVPRQQLRVCEAAVQMCFVFQYSNNESLKVRTEKDLPMISLFSGAGGLDIGFDQAGFRTAVMVEFDPACCRTLRKNMPNTPVLEGDINQIGTDQILSAAGLKPLDAALVIGGPPCQSFSLAGKRMGLNDPRGKLVLEFIRVVRESLPRAFVMENVRGLTNWEKGRALDAILNEAQEPIVYNGKTYSYKVAYKILNAADYGAPQFRERVFIVGNRVDCDYVFPEKKYGASDNADGLKPYVTVRDAICHLPPATPPSEVALRVSGTIKARIEKHGY